MAHWAKVGATELLSEMTMQELTDLAKTIQEEKAKRLAYTFVPDYRFSGRVGCENSKDGTLHKSCDAFMMDVSDGVLHGEKCLLCGFTFWIDPENGGAGDDRNYDKIWEATQKFEAEYNGC